MTKENLKQALISILIAGLAAFFSTIAQALGEFVKAHAVDTVSAVVAAGVYLAKAYKA